MTLRRACLECIGLIAITIALTGTLLSGVAAALAFPLMKKLGVTLTEYAAYPEAHWRLAGGHIAQPIFTLTLLTTSACVVLTLLVLALLWLSKNGPSVRSLTVRLIAVLVTFAAVVANAAVQWSMNQNLTVMRAAAKAGDIAAAKLASDSFGKQHPVSTVALLALAGCLLLTLLLWVPGLATQRQSDR